MKAKEKAKSQLSSIYSDDAIEIRSVKTKADLEREIALIKTEKIAKCIKYDVAPKYRKQLFEAVFNGG